jgi:hypothetical protein
MYFLLSLLITVSIITSCSSDKSVNAPTVVKETELNLITPSIEETAIPTPGPFTAPLIGLGSDTLTNNRPIMVMVENTPIARPQTGLNDADVVYEILAEGEITRFVAVYQSKLPEVIGPIRSIRPYFVEIGKGLDAIIVHAGWSQDAMNKIIQLKVDHLDQVYGDDRYYWRDNARKKPHNLYTSIEKINQAAIDKKFHTDWKNPQLKFTSSAEPKLAGQAVNNITIPYIAGYEVGYTYNIESRLFSRSMMGDPHQDKVSGKTIETTNVIICEAAHQILDSAGRRAVNIHGPGKGYLLQEGNMKKITWEEKNGFIRVSDETSELGLLPGKTWIQVVPEDTEIKVM